MLTARPDNQGVEVDRFAKVNTQRTAIKRCHANSARHIKCSVVIAVKQVLVPKAPFSEQRLLEKGLSGFLHLGYV